MRCPPFCLLDFDAPGRSFVRLHGTMLETPGWACLPSKQLEQTSAPLPLLVRLVIDGAEVVSSQGIHPAYTVSGTVSLSAGWHTLR